MKRLLFLLLVLTAFGYAAANPAALVNNVPNRTTISLNGAWQAIVDPYETGLNARFYLNAKAKDKHELLEYDFDKSDVLNVPGDWNSQKKELFFYEGPVWYKKSFSYHKREHTRVFVYFGAANYFTRVYLNGQALGEHEGGFTPFNFEVTDQIREGENFVVVEVNNARRRDAVPTVNTDWWNYGGLTRDVMLVEVPETFIQDYLVQLAKGSGSEISGWVQLSGSLLGAAGHGGNSRGEDQTDRYHGCRRPRGVPLSRQARAMVARTSQALRRCSVERRRQSTRYHRVPHH